MNFFAVTTGMTLFLSLQFAFAGESQANTADPGMVLAEEILSASKVPDSTKVISAKDEVAEEALEAEETASEETVNAPETTAPNVEIKEEIAVQPEEEKAPELHAPGTLEFEMATIDLLIDAPEKTRGKFAKAN
jgi:hypothetical protein